MHICHVMPALFPIAKYGGAERAAYYLAKGLAELGHRNTFLCLEGSKIDFAKTIAYNPQLPVEEQLPKSFDILQLYSTPSKPPSCPYLVCIQGNGRPGEVFLPNTIFLSRDHAQRHGWTEFVYNGIDPNEYPFGSSLRSNNLLFLAKGSWPIKNLYGALCLAKRANASINVLGAEAKFWDSVVFPSAYFYGMIGGEEKLRVLQNSQTLLFPVLWSEPFGVALIEALACGVSVIGSAWGSIPEIVDSTCGRVCSTGEEFLHAIRYRNQWKPMDCRNRVLSNFTHRHQAERYLNYYRRILKDSKLREGNPHCPLDFVQEEVRPIKGLALSPRAKFKWLKQRFF